MIKEKSLVAYKNRPAVVSGISGDKISISCPGGESFKVREKDIEEIHGGPCTLSDLKESPSPGGVREAWELLSGDAGETGDAEGAPISIKELAELAFGAFSPAGAWAAYELLKEGRYFSGDVTTIRARNRKAVEEDEKKREEKQREAEERAAFLDKLKKFPPYRSGAASSFNAAPDNVTPGRDTALSGSERRFLLDVEALAYGQSNKSRTLKDLGKSETPEEAHRLLLACGAWTLCVNPYPARFGLERTSAKIVPPPPPDEERLDLTHLAAYAIDNEWSDDPDDAVSLEGPDAEGRLCLWVHVADPASSILPGSSADREARDRGSTLYLPEGPSRMLAPETLPFYALGYGHSAELLNSPALSFRITVKPDFTIGEIDIFPSLVKVTRLSYAEADKMMAGTNGGDTGEKDSIALTSLMALAEGNMERRLNTGAVIIDLPETHMQVSHDGNFPRSISVEQIPSYRSAEMIRECMVYAGEGAARWAMQRQIPFPFISQEAGEFPQHRLPGLAGAWQIRRCMRPRVLSAKPAVHWGLGLDEYTQVTSPLRRYTDLLCHQQIRAFLGGREPLAASEVLLRASAAEAAAAASVKAEKASRAHWMAVYLSDKHDDAWEGIVLDRKGNRGVVIIPALGIETQTSLKGTEEPNDTVKLRVSSVKIPEGEVQYALC